MTGNAALMSGCPTGMVLYYPEEFSELFNMSLYLEENRKGVLKSD